ncbi:MAG TPA: protein kinase [Candidatus Saccharimonadales bacterium]|nr:protein kinase [Candidatus Saccharimonadales bacterium]
MMNSDDTSRSPGELPSSDPSQTLESADGGATIDNATFEGAGIAHGGARVRVAPLPGEIGHYKIIRRIGEGGMGTVYEAEQDRPRRTVALKVIRPGFATPDLLRRFDQESHALGRLHHPGIAQIYEAGTAETNLGPQPYFAMEFIRGQRLLEYSTNAKLNVKQRMELAAKIADAMQHAHERGIIHRDLKPGNILVTENGQPKILDFGVARVTDSDFQATRQTDVGQLVGTIPYMSPEQVSADPEALDTRSDVYAMGVILYQLLAGRLPYDLRQKSLPDAVRVIREEDPTPLSSISRVYRGDIDTIIGKALEKEKVRRYPAAAELAADIRRYLADEPIAARPPSAAYQLSKFAIRNRVLVAGVAAVIVVLAAGATASTILAIRATRAQKLAEERRVQTEQAKNLAVQREQEAKAALLLAEGRRAEAESSRKAADSARSAEAVQRKAAEHSALQAKEQSARAEHNFDLAKDSVDKYFIQVSQSPELRTQNLEKLRRNLLVTAREFYQKFTNERSTDAFLQADFGHSLSTLGAIDVSMGENKQAIEVLEHAKTILEPAAKQNPNNRVIEQNLFMTYQQLGQVYENTSVFDKAEAEDRRAILVAGDWAKTHPDDADNATTLASANENLGKLISKFNRMDEAVSLTKTGMTIREDLMKKHPDDEQYRNGLLTADVNLVSFYGAMGKIKEALPYAEQAVVLGERMYAAHPEDPDTGNRLGVGYNNLGGVYRLLDRIADSKQAHLRSLEIREKLAREHPALVDYTVFLSGSYINLGELAEGDAKPKEALEWLGKGEQTLLGVLEKEKKQATARFYLSYDYSWQARAYEDLGQQDEASKRWTLAIDYDDHHDPQLKLSRAMALAHKGEYEKAAAQADELGKEQTLPETLYRLAGVYALSSSAASAAGNESVATSCRGKAMDMLNHVSAAGYFKDAAHVQKMEQDLAFAGIRTRQEFQQFSSGLSVSAKK